MPFRGELYLPPDFEPKTTERGRFRKGNVPFNKGKKWSDYMSKRSQKRAAKGWENLEKFRPAHPDNAGRKKKPIIAVMDDGSWCYFSHTTPAAKWCGGCRENINRCCKMNFARHVNIRNGKVNTDHRYMGIRFYFEADDIWTEKIKKE